MERKEQTPHEIHFFRVKRKLSDGDIRKLVTQDPDHIMYFDTEKLVSRLQIEIAVQRSLHFHIEDKTRIKSLSAIMAMMLSGERQIERALARVGISQATMRVVCISLADHEIPDSDMFEPDEEGLPMDAKDYDRKVFHAITDAEYHLSQ